MITLMFRVFPTQSGIVAIMNRQLIRHNTGNRVVGAAFFGQLVHGSVVVCAVFGTFLATSRAAEYIVEDRRDVAPSYQPPRQRNAPDPSSIASGALSFDGLVGEPSTRSILQPIAEDEAEDSAWSSGGASVAVIDDADSQQPSTLDSEWIVSGDTYANYSCDDSESFDWSDHFGWDSISKMCGGMSLFDRCKKNCHCGRCGCWTGQIDAVLLWRNAPPKRELATFASGPSVGTSALDAHHFNSTLAGGPRIGIVRQNTCGNAAEFIYWRAFNFRSQRPIPENLPQTYEVADIFGVSGAGAAFTEAQTNLGSSFQTFEANSRTPIGNGSFTFLAGLRWLEWQESFSMDTSISGAQPLSFRSDVVNSMYGGQLGIDAWLLTMPWVKINTWLKGGAYYNNAVQHTSFNTTTPGVVPVAPFRQSVSGSPAAGSFLGEVGINGTLPLSPCIDFRFGYTAFWLETIAMATQQLSNQNELSTNGGTVLQGVNFGLEGTW